MIDLNYEPKQQPKKGWDPEEKAMAVFATAIFIANIIIFLEVL